MTLPVPVVANDAQRAQRWGLFAGIMWLLGVSWTVVDILQDPRPKLRHHAIIDTAYFTFALWAGALGLALTTTRQEWVQRRGRFQVFRLVWALACSLYLAHVAVSFHFAHAWSHANALRHVQQASGFGRGLYVSYAFSVVWLADVLWVLFRSSSYAVRSPRFAALLHGFLAFVTFNATVIFGRGLMQWVCGGVFAILLGCWLVNRPWRPSAHQ